MSEQEEDSTSRARASKRRSARRRRQLQKQYVLSMQQAIQDLSRENEILGREQRMLQQAHAQPAGFVATAELNDLLVANEQLRAQLFVELTTRLPLSQLRALDKATGLLGAYLQFHQA